MNTPYYRAAHPDWDAVVWKRMKQDPRKELLKAARRRSRQRGRAFSIGLDDIVVPERCPILGIPLQHAERTPTEFSITG